MQKSFEESFAVTPDTDFDDGFWNRFVNDLGVRLRGLDSIVISWELVRQQGLSVALARINEVLLPAGERIRELTELGFLVAGSTSSATMVEGETVELELTAGTQADLFTASEFLAVTRIGTVEDYAVARFVSLDRETRVLRAQVVAVFGNPGPHADWEISAVAATVLAGVEAMATAIIARDLARDWAEKANGQAVDGVNTRSAKHWATAASTSAAGASGSASAAAISAGSASASAASAGASLASFTAVYRGALTGDPAGGQNGHFYFYLHPTDPSQNIMKVYSVGTATWVPAVSAALGGVKRQDYSAALGNLAAAQTTFAVGGGFTSLDVFVNGLQLVQGVGFTVASPNFTLAAGVAGGDVVQARGYAANDVSDFYTKAQADAAFAAKTHGHSIANVAGLQSALDGKAPSAHGHLIADVAGLQGALNAKANASALGELAALDWSDLVYSGSNSSNTSYPRGTTILCSLNALDIPRNTTVSPAGAVGDSSRFSSPGDSFVLAGTWKTRGRINGAGSYQLERIA